MAEARIIIVDDHPLFRDALGNTLSSSFPDIEVAQASAFGDLTQQLEQGMSLDLILLDLNVPGVQGFSGLLYLRAQYPHIPVVIVSATEDPGTVRRSLDLGASGFIPKSQPVDQIRAALRRIMNGEVWFPEDVDASGVEEETRVLAARLARLTPQQMRVLMMLSEGLLNKQIAYNLNVSEATVKAHVSAILQKLDVDSRTQAVIAINRLSAADRAG
jgi:DNA-binding NarL/FixJ family response regulator